LRCGFIVSALLAAASAAAADPSAEQLAGQIADAVVQGRPLPDVPETVDERTAYRIQALWTGTVYGGGNVGYKAGLTNAAAQARFGIDFPVLGLLPASARLDSGAVLQGRAGLMLEVEVGFVVGDDAAPAAMMPVVEIPYLNYAAPTELDLADVVASNVSAYRFIAGPQMAFDTAVAGTNVTLTRDGELVNRGTGRDAMGDPVEAYRWMARKAAALGYPLEPGMVMLTGALGRIVDAESGTYVASFGPLGELTFTIR